MTFVSNSSPGELGFRMPAEWARHDVTWLTWPRPEGISFSSFTNEAWERGSREEITPPKTF
jgi:agmatine deiminase